MTVAKTTTLRAPHPHPLPESAQQALDSYETCQPSQP